MDVSRLAAALLAGAAAAATALTATATAQAASPLLSFPSKASVKEGSEAKITIKLNKKATADGSVRFATSARSASSDDFLVEKGTLDIPSGKRSVTLSVFSEGDPIDEADETFRVAFSRPRGVRLRGRRTITVTITDDDPAPTADPLVTPVFGEPGATPTPVPPEAHVRQGESVGSGSGGTTGTIIDDRPTLQINDLETNEGSLTQPTVSLSKAYAKPVTVDWRIAPPGDGDAVLPEEMEAGVDYTNANGTVTIPAGETSAVVGVGLLDDNWDDFPGTERARLFFSNPSNVQLFDAESAIAVTDDDEAPVVSVPNVPNATTEGNAIPFTVVLSHPSETEGFAAVETEDGMGSGGAWGGEACGPMIDFIKVSNAAVQFPAGTTSAPVNVTTCLDEDFDSGSDLYLRAVESDFPISETQLRGQALINDAP